MLVFRPRRRKNSSAASLAAGAGAAALLCAAVSLPVFVVAKGATAKKTAQQQNNTPMSFTGEVTDSHCTRYSHEAMMKKEGYKNAKECTQGCVKEGAKFVLYADANDTVYQLDDQDKPAGYAGQKVTIIGTYDGETKTIHIQSIEAAP
jgi:hypothetical protein